MTTTDLKEPILGCRTIDEAIEALTILEAMRQNEGVSIILLCDNPDFGGGPNSIIEVAWDFCELPKQFSGDTVLECLRAAHQAHKARANG